MTDEPTTSSEVLALLDTARDRTFARLSGLTDAEYLWEPAPDVLTIRTHNGVSRADPVPEPEPDQPPMGTIAWRIWHIGQDCLHGYRVRFFQTTPELDDVLAYPATATAGIEALRHHWDAFRTDVAAMSDEELLTLMGPHARAYAEYTYLSLVLHALDEIIHHGAELGLLRDLYLRR